MNMRPAFFIMSSHHDDVPAAPSNTLLTRQLKQAGYATAPCRGFYLGKHESSTLVIDEDPSTDKCLDDVLRLGRLHCQETILAVDSNRCASLVNCITGGRSPLGIFQSVPEGVAKAQDAWTERAGRYYVCR